MWVGGKNGLNSELRNDLPDLHEKSVHILLSALRFLQVGFLHGVGLVGPAGIEFLLGLAQQGCPFEKLVEQKSIIHKEKI
jgi:hypothetical protein